MSQNLLMTPMQRIDKELKLRKLTWTALRTALGASKQSVTNWRKDGIPAKHYSKIDDFFGKPYGWTELGVEAKSAANLALPNDPDRMETILGTVAAAFRMIPEDEWGEALLDVSSVLQKRGRFR